MRALRSLAAGFLGLFLVVAAQAAPKSYTLPEQAGEALKLEAQLKRTDTQGKSADIWLKEAIALIKADDWKGGAESLAAAIAADPTSEPAWRNYAVTQQRIETDDWDEKYKQRERARAAAYKTYLVSTTAKDEARALAVLGNAFSQQEMWRPALNTYAESLKRLESAEVRATYEKLREEQGFRVLDYTVDSDAASPRACVQFSEPLAGGRVDFAPFVKVAGMDAPAVTRNDNQLCVDGLKHGETYELTVRAGVPSSVNENLAKAADFTIYVRDRKPSVRFTGRNYVLPRTGNQSIPLVTTNLDAVKVEILRIGDRGLAATAGGEEFQTQLNYESFQQMGQRQGAQVYAGGLTVERKLNADVTTAFPLDEALKTYEPGVYVMVAYLPGQEEEYDPVATQWFIVSDLGLTALSGPDGIHGIVRAIGSAQPVSGVEVRLIARNNEVLATQKSNESGAVRFDAALTRGQGGLAPELLVASHNNDYAFMSLSQPGFDLSDRGVAGRNAPGPLDAQVFTERGVYRPGETVHATALLRDASAKAVTDLPLTLVLLRPDGAEDRRVLVPDQGNGGRVLDMALLDMATTGTWRLRAFADPKQPAVGEVTFLVEDYTPERMDLKLNTTAQSLGAEPIQVNMDGNYLYGAPAADLAVEGDITVKVSQTPLPGLTGYQFGLADETVAAVRTPLVGLPKTDDKGHAVAQIAQPALPATGKPLEALIALRLREPSGRTLERTLTLPVTPKNLRIGVKPLFGDQIGEGENANFDVVVLGPDNKPQSRKGLKWELSRIETRFQWYSSNNRWTYETINSATRVANGVLDLQASTPIGITAKVESGQYRLDVTDESGAATSVSFNAGWSTAGAADTPDTMDVSLDKANYRAGEKATLTLQPRFAGKATVMVVGEKLLSSQVLDVDAKSTTLKLDVNENWGSGVYVLAFVHRPLDAKASRMPGRAIGVAYARIDTSPRVLPVTLDVAEQVRPRGTMRVPVKVGNLAEGESAHIVVAAVDVGILNLTHFEPPSPADHFYAQQKLSMEVRDLYGQLIDGLRATRGKLRSGGDSMGDSAALGETPTQAPLALFSGLVTVGRDGTAEVAFDLPAFNGTVKLMAVAWSKDKVGAADRDVIVADPVVVTATLPKTLAKGDHSRLLLNLDNVSGAAGDYKLSVVVDGPVKAEGALAQTLKLAAKGRADVELPLEATGIGAARLDVALIAPDGARLEQSLALSVHAPTPPVAKRSLVTLAAKSGKVEITADLLKDFVPGSGAVALSVGLHVGLDPAGVVQALRDYPYGCSEQLTSRATALLYADEVGVAQPEDVREKMADFITRILSRQSSNGSFGLWSSGGDDLWLNAYVSDFLGRAREKGFEVPDRTFSLALDQLKNTLGYRNAEDSDEIGADVLYAHYVLARNGRAIVGDLRYLADVKLDGIASPLARAHLGAALSMIGDGARAGKAFASAEKLLDGEDRTTFADYGTPLRDRAAVLSLAAENGAGASIVPAVVKAVDTARAETKHLSTQENAWLLRAARAIKVDAAKVSLTVNGKPQSGLVNRTFRADELAGGAVTVGNAGDGPVMAAITVRGSPNAPEPAAEEGFMITREYFSLDGKRVDPAHVAQNTRLVAVLTVTEPEPQEVRVLLVDYLPAGLEIENPRLVTGGDVEALSWLPQEAQAAHAEFRDDRFVAAFERNGDSSGQTMTAAYVVRAVTPGRYAHPAATVEDMYRPERFARTAAGSLEVTGAK